VEHFDVVIMGAGLSGIDAAYHLQKLCPKKSYVILEQRERIGGTWDLFRYPGIRSDSDMFTMGYSFRPWLGSTAISPGPAIRDYISSTAQQEGIDRHIRFRHRVLRASWRSEEAQWTIEAIGESGDRPQPVALTCNFLLMCAGYYRYSAGYTPDFPGIGRFAGRVVHPQAWPEDLDHAGKRVVIIGSGATAVTILPAMAETAAHVTMLQRSPTYVVSVPAHDAIANLLRRILPVKWA
jgi:cation diffusion facilitator CzcD-associated flavoprotein CzcO